MKILITTGIYPPKIGGPAQYAKNLRDTFIEQGYQVRVATYTIESRLPTGLRHLFFLVKILPSVLWSDRVVALDTYSVGLPTVFACKVLGKKSVIRTGGDFLWENYVERTRKKILLRDFYKTEVEHFNLKEKVIFLLTGWVLNNVGHLVFSTDWQRQIFLAPYKLALGHTSVIENYYGPKESDLEPKGIEFVASARKLVWKNLDLLTTVFERIKKKNQQTRLLLDNLPYNKFMERMASCYAVVLVSLGDISPNMIMDAIRLNRPFICTREVGIYDRIREAGLFIDPQNESEIEEAVGYLLSEEGYKEAKRKVSSFNYVHTWRDIVGEFLEILKK